MAGAVERLFARVRDSWAQGEAELAARQAAGLQPSTPGADFVTLVAANVAYVAITAALYAWMSKRESGFKLKKVLLVYNFTCIIAAGYCAVGIVLHKLQNPGSFACNPLDVGPSGQHLAFVFWVFYAQKFWEFLDTWFFILRKSFRQVTFLHLFHHSSITIVVGSVIPYDFSGDMFLPILLNSIVHVLMYGHYFVTALGIKSWWSQYLTSLQLLQFITISVQSYLSYRAGATCGAPDWVKMMMVGYMVSMLVLFGNFFLRKYVLRKPNQNMCGVIKTVEEPARQVYNGVATIQEDGTATVVLPAWFRPFHHAAGTSYSYLLTPVGAPMPTLHVSREVDFATCRFWVAGGVAGCKVSWQLVAEAPAAGVPSLDGSREALALNGKKTQ